MDTEDHTDDFLDGLPAKQRKKVMAILFDEGEGIEGKTEQIEEEGESTGVIAFCRKAVDDSIDQPFPWKALALLIVFLVSVGMALSLLVLLIVIETVKEIKGWQ